MQNEQLWRKLEEDNRIELKAILKEVAIGLIAGMLFVMATGWLYFVTVMAR